MIELTALSGGLAAACGAVDTVPYVRGTLRGTTVPHRGTWLVWSALGLVAVESQRADGARWSLVPLVAQAGGTCLVFVLSVRLGSGGLSAADLTLIGVALAGVVVWRVADAPFVATSCVIAADLLAALMMMPKTWQDPHSETLVTFAIASLGGVLTIGSVGSSAASLLAYPVYFALVNGALAGIIAYRRGRVVGPAGSEDASQEVPESVREDGVVEPVALVPSGR